MSTSLKKFSKCSFITMSCLILIFILCLTSLSVQSVYAGYPGANGKIAVAITREGDLEIFTINSDGSNEIQLTFNAALDPVPHARANNAANYSCNNPCHSRIFHIILTHFLLLSPYIFLQG